MNNIYYFLDNNHFCISIYFFANSLNLNHTINKYHNYKHKFDMDFNIIYTLILNCSNSHNHINNYLIILIVNFNNLNNYLYFRNKSNINENILNISHFLHNNLHYKHIEWILIDIILYLNRMCMYRYY